MLFPVCYDNKRMAFKNMLFPIYVIINLRFQCFHFAKFLCKKPIFLDIVSKYSIENKSDKFFVKS